MIDEIRAVIEKKFTRCPQCRSFSVRETNHLTFKEKFQRYFRTVTIYVCDNCSYRFGEFGNISPRHILKYSRLVFPILALAVLAAIFLLSPGKEKKPVVPNTGGPGVTSPVVENKPITGVERPKEEKNQPAELEKPQEQVTPTEKTGSNPTFAGDIVLGGSNRFGVNWRPLPGGVSITRLSEGPVKKAGLKVGDIITEVEGSAVTNQGENLEKARDEVFNGKRPEVIIKVLRKKESLFFRIIKG